MQTISLNFHTEVAAQCVPCSIRKPLYPSVSRIFGPPKEVHAWAIQKPMAKTSDSFRTKLQEWNITQKEQPI